MKEGMQSVWDYYGLRIIMGMSMIINLVINACAYLQSAGGIGMIIGGLVLGVWGASRTRW
jgi:hypothetical protein